jgi:hypothetical protein
MASAIKMVARTLAKTESLSKNLQHETLVSLKGGEFYATGGGGAKTRPKIPITRKARTISS